MIHRLLRKKNAAPPRAPWAPIPRPARRLFLTASLAIAATFALVFTLLGGMLP